MELNWEVWVWKFYADTFQRSMCISIFVPIPYNDDDDDEEEEEEEDDSNDDGDDKVGFS